MTSAPPKRRIWLRPSIAAGNAMQIAGLVLGCLLLMTAAQARTASLAVLEMLVGLVLIYLSCHAIAHWLVGRVLGIRFRSYTVGGTSKPEVWPVGLRWIMEHVPFFGVQTDRDSMKTAVRAVKAAMWSAGVTSSAVVPTLAAFWCVHTHVRMSKLVFLFLLIWSVGTLIANLAGPSGDYFKARMALKA
jgi:hypothetical protein